MEPSFLHFALLKSDGGGSNFFSVSPHTRPFSSFPPLIRFFTFDFNGLHLPTCNPEGQEKEEVPIFLHTVGSEPVFRNGPSLLCP